MIFSASNCLFGEQKKCVRSFWGEQVSILEASATGAFGAIEVKPMIC